jgi:hypothetical protein
MTQSSTLKQGATAEEGPKPATIRFILAYSKSIKPVATAGRTWLVDQN